MINWLAVSWAIGLGLLTGAIAGTLAPSTSLGHEVRQIAGFSLVFVPALYVITTRRWEQWRATNGYVSFAVYFLSFLVAAAVLVGLSVVAFGSTGAVAQGSAFVATTAAFAIASWLTFGGGADLIWAELLERDIIEW